METLQSKPSAPVEQAFTDYGAYQLADYPHDSEWSLPYDTCRFLSSLIEKTTPKKIVELGSGYSTKLIAEQLKKHSPDGRVLSIDGIQQYAEQTQQLLHDHELQHIAEVVTAPVRLRLVHNRLLYWYRGTARKIAQHGPIDLALVDGPPGILGREAALYVLMRAMRPGGIILLDDAKRPDMEQRWLSNWKSAYGDSIDIHFEDEFERGLAVVTVHQPRKAAVSTFQDFIGSLRQVYYQYHRHGIFFLLNPEKNSD